MLSDANPPDGRLNHERVVWPDNAFYFLTDSTYLHFPYFDDDEQKEIVLKQILKLQTNLGVKLQSYSIACNHYHLALYLEYGTLLSKVWQLLRGGISFEYRKRFKSKYEEMWQTRKTVVINGPRMKYLINGYIMGNLLKHREVSTFSGLNENRYSSFWHAVRLYGVDEARSMVYRVIGMEEDDWGGVDMKGFGVI